MIRWDGPGWAFALVLAAAVRSGEPSKNQKGLKGSESEGFDETTPDSVVREPWCGAVSKPRFIRSRSRARCSLGSVRVQFRVFAHPLCR